MAAYIDIDAAIVESEKLLKVKREVMERIDIVRSDLRNAVKLGGATAPQREYVEKNYPLVERKRKAKA